MAAVRTYELGATFFSPSILKLWNYGVIQLWEHASFVSGFYIERRTNAWQQCEYYQLVCCLTVITDREQVVGTYCVDWGQTANVPVSYVWCSFRKSTIRNAANCAGGTIISDNISVTSTYNTYIVLLQRHCQDASFHTISNLSCIVDALQLK
jgi:hypothetical protein